jgi:ribonuclease-3
MRIFRFGKSSPRNNKIDGTPSNIQKEVRVLEKRISYQFSNPLLLQEALTHPSFDLTDSVARHNQRLEFLGDSVLGCIFADWLCNHFPAAQEGDLSKKKSLLAHGHHLTDIARNIGLEEFLLTGKSEVGKNGKLRDSVLEDALEALIGSIFLDGGYAEASRVVSQWTEFFEQTIRKKSSLFNPKGRLQEYTQSLADKPRIHYRVIRQSGPDHMREFEVELTIGQNVVSRGIGGSKKKAEETAAAKALAELVGQ